MEKNTKSIIRYVIPFDTTKNIGKSYNEAFRGLDDNDFVCFVDGDTIFLDSHFGVKIEKILEDNPDINAATCMTNRVGCKWQVYDRVNWFNENMLDHNRLTNECWERHGYKVTDSTNEQLMSGVMILLRKSTWEKIGKFKEDGMLGIDNDIHQKLIDNNEKLWLMNGIYLYHKYRFGDMKNKKHLL
jgi:hypothetical protein